ncbi:hypothetical protein Clacol_008848 [Clathrus columnatus]|uniref:Protein SMG7 n=1 Tax=Clathrus columnatus TaxID=1419009 RepID=A0AAV5AIV4_9AGAM|nr:hypothetical protein Clacol_008848 [Clathrus columnatus]
MQDLNPTAISIARRVLLVYHSELIIRLDNRQVKTLVQGLKESLAKLDPWERDIEFQRSNLRRQLLQLILVHPYSKESKDADHSLWMTTSYYLISAYKSRIAAADAIVHHSANESHSHRANRSEVNGHYHGKVSFVEYRKLVHRFRQFLAEEEKFWTNFIIRIVRVFDIQGSRSTLATLGIVVGPDNLSETSPTRNGRRNLFPNEDVTQPPSPNQKEQKLVMLSKALVYLGDIARYREHYNEGGGRPRAGKDFHDDTKSASRGRGGRRGAVDQLPRPRNYSKAQECYERARLLVPDVGNACHQLAILAGYQQDTFGGILQYYRAMCVKQPYETAASNLDSTLSRNLEVYKSTIAKADSGEQQLQSPKARVERFKKTVVTLHALWRLDPAEADKQLPGHDDIVVATFSVLTSERILPTDIIWKTLLMAFGALWRYRMLRDPNASRNSEEAPANESRIFSHIAHLMLSLFQIGIVQLSEAANSPEPAIAVTSHSAGEVRYDLAQNITAVFRRTLPALRVGSKWLKAHINYVLEVLVRFGPDAETNIETLMSSFWSTYDEFITLLEKIFPLEKLPKLNVALEEDIEASGFAPLKNVMVDITSETVSGVDSPQNQMHPNEEQLMRIADLLVHAEKLRSLREELLPAMCSPKLASALKNQAPAVSDPSHQDIIVQACSEPGQTFDIDDDNVTVSTRTDDDPVNLAMKAILTSDEDDEEEKVLYPKQSVAPINPPSLSSSRQSAPAIVPTSNPSLNLNQSSFAVSSTPVQSRVPLAKPLTAEDLVNEMMRIRVIPESTALSKTLAPSSPLPNTTRLLFGSGTPGTLTSIWSATPHDSVSLSANNIRKIGYPGAQARVSSPVSNMSSYTSASNLQNLGVASTAFRNDFTHQRQSSQLLYGAIGSPVQGAHGPWGDFQDSSHPSMSSQVSYQRHTLSPIAPPSFSDNELRRRPSYPPVSSQTYSSIHNLGGLSKLPPQQLSPLRQTINDRTWSYTGLESLSGIGSSLTPFNHGQTPPQPMPGSGGWT